MIDIRENCRYYEFTCTNGEIYLMPCEDVAKQDLGHVDTLQKYCPDTIDYWSVHTGTLGRWTLDGYLDCGEWCLYADATEAMEELE